MKTSFLLIALLIGSVISTNAQESSWELPKINIPLVSEGKEIANLGVEKVWNMQI
ncbi:hypothetical protein V8V91_06550 [Algoriphagus halophilus]|uniref:hypothetical protein n=1 Tax=Algoriphagus halophilus TaxID=226505 RepID=UPI00358FBEE9